MKTGTISRDAALFTTTALVLFGMDYLILIPFLVYAVPCVAAYRKSPAKIWRTCTLVSLAGSFLMTLYVTFFFSSETYSDGLEILFAILTNGIFVFGFCLLPLNILSTVDTIRRKIASKTTLNVSNKP